MLAERDIIVASSYTKNSSLHLKCEGWEDDVLVQT